MLAAQGCTQQVSAGELFNTHPFTFVSSNVHERAYEPEGRAV